MLIYGKFILFFSIASIVSTANADSANIQFNDCNPSQQHEITVAVERATETGARLVKKLTIAALNSRYREVEDNLISAQSTAACANHKLEILNFTCIGPNKKMDAETFPIFGRNVKIGDSFFTYERQRQAAVIYHESTHKCGTNDNGYFINRGEGPPGSSSRDWQSIADTYYYWIWIGFCVPGFNCTDQEKANSRRQKL